jgi:cytochrome b pre-mRNA-processing protein 3
MFFERFRKKKSTLKADRVLHDAAVAQSRIPTFYRDWGVPDSVEGRFELLTLHIILLLERLKDEPAIRQGLFDTYVSDLDGALREMGVGDLSVPKRMKGLGGVFYGRAKAYDDAFRSLPDKAPLIDLIGRTIPQGAMEMDTRSLAAYVTSCRERLAVESTPGIVRGDIPWVQP